MLRDELEFMVRMRASLRGIVQLDPETIPARLVEMDRAILELEGRLAADRAAAPPPIAAARELRAA